VLGLVGLGGIGRAVALRAISLGMRVVGTDPSISAQEQAAGLGINVRGLDETAQSSDYLVIAASLTPSTEGLINERLLLQMPKGSRLINVARGRIVDEPGLIAALKSGHLGGAALDVYATEPPASDNPLLSMESVILGSHNSSHTVEGVTRASARAVENLIEQMRANAHSRGPM
jgi:D-3-phosphoglycerate dehydrogenase / 2-oxoglutarate reductase